MDLLLVIDENKPHYVYIKDFDRFMFHKTKKKTKSTFVDFDSNLNSVENYECSHSKKYEDHDPFNFAYQLVCMNDEFTKLIVNYRGKNAAYEFIKAILKECEYGKKCNEKSF